MEKNEREIHHIAIIMDGNGRWAKQHGLPHLEGHRHGAETVLKVVEAAGALGIKYLTLYAFSTENWKRPEAEVEGLMILLRQFLDEKLEELNARNIRLMAIGRLERLPAAVSSRLKTAIASTADNTGGTLILALNYGGRAEIVDAAKKIAADAADGKITINELDEAQFSRYLYAPSIPDPDLLIRTSGELRLSNFLLWELSYSEIYISEVFWPDFDAAELDRAVAAFYHRERRFGGRNCSS